MLELLAAITAAELVDATVTSKQKVNAAPTAAAAGHQHMMPGLIHLVSHAVAA